MFLYCCIDHNAELGNHYAEKNTVFDLITAHTRYKRTVKQFHNLPITASVFFVYFFFIK